MEMTRVKKKGSRCPDGTRKPPARSQRTMPPRLLSRSQFKQLEALEDTIQLFPRPRNKNKAQLDAAVQGRPELNKSL